MKRRIQAGPQETAACQALIDHKEATLNAPGHRMAQVVTWEYYYHPATEPLYHGRSANRNSHETVQEDSQAPPASVIEGSGMDDVIMKKSIRSRMEGARNRSAAKGTMTVKRAPSAMLMSSSVALEAVREVNEGAALTLKDVQERLHCEKKKAIRLIKNEPGVMKIGKSYLIPQSAFDRVLRRSLVAA